MAVATFNPEKGLLISEFDPLTDRQIEEILGRLRFTHHPVPKLAENIEHNYITLLRRDLRGLRLNPDGIEEFITQLQRRIDTSEIKDGIGVGNATASAITATGTQEAFNVKRQTGKKTTVGNNKALDVVKGKKDPIDEGALVAYYKPPTYADAYYQIEDMKEIYLSDFIDPIVDTDTAIEFHIPEWYHEMAALASGNRFDTLFGRSSEERSEERPSSGSSQRHIFMRLTVNVDLAYRRQVTMTELAKAVESIILPKKDFAVKMMAIPSPLLVGNIDVGLIEVEKAPLSELSTKKQVYGEDITQLRHRQVLDVLRKMIFDPKTSPLIRGIRGVTDMEVNRDSVNDAIEDIYENIETEPKYQVAIMPKNWDDLFPDKFTIRVNNRGALQPLVVEDKRFAKIADSMVGKEFIFEGGNVKGLKSTPLRRWTVDIKAFSRIYQSIGVIPVLRFLTFYDDGIEQVDTQVYVRVYDTLKYPPNRLVTASAILKEPSRYFLSGNRLIPNSKLTNLQLRYPGDLNILRKRVLKLSKKANSPEKYNPRFHISHRTYGRVFYNLLQDANVDIDMTTYSNGMMVSFMLGIEACYTIMTFALIDSLGEGINPQHASMFSSHRTVTGTPTTLSLTSRATVGMGPITASQMNPPVATFGKTVGKGVGESTQSTVGFMCSAASGVTEADFGDITLDAYGRPIIDHFNKEAATPMALGFAPIADSKAEKVNKIIGITEILLSVNKASIEGNVKKIRLNVVEPINPSKLRTILSAFSYRPITGRFYNPSLGTLVASY